MLRNHDLLKETDNISFLFFSHTGEAIGRKNDFKVEKV